MVGAEGLGDGDGGWGWVGVLGVSKIYKKWGMGVGGWGNMPKICQKWELPLWFKVAIGMDGSFVDDKHDDLPWFNDLPIQTGDDVK